MDVIARLGRLSPVRLVEWGHTEHYHPMLLRHVPSGAERALDVGCGSGRFARELAALVAEVDAIDVSPDAIALAWTRVGKTPNVSLQVADLLTADLEPGAYDYVSCLMAIHHMPFEPALARLASAVKPGGALVILGLARLGLTDVPRAVAVVPLDFAMGVRFKLAQAVGRPSLSGVGPEAPIADPALRTSEIRTSVRRLLPESVFTNHLFHRYSIVWRRPPRPDEGAKATDRDQR